MSCVGYIEENASLFGDNLAGEPIPTRRVKKGPVGVTRKKGKQLSLLECTTLPGWC